MTFNELLLHGWFESSPRYSSRYSAMPTLILTTEVLGQHFLYVFIYLFIYSLFIYFANLKIIFLPK